MHPILVTKLTISEKKKSGLNAKTKLRLVFAFFLNSVPRPFQDYFSSYEMGQSVGGRKRENPEKNHLAHPQAELERGPVFDPIRGNMFCP